MQPHDTTQDIPYGYCHCGCGQKTRIATKSRPQYGHVKGQPLYYINGHQGRAPHTVRHPLPERFWQKVDKLSPDDCWEWKGGKSPQGYGVIAVNQRGQIASRVSYEMHFGSIPDGLCVLHKCDNPSCVNPAHLFLGTNSDNVADREAKGRNKPRYGAENGMAELTNDRVIDIRERFAKGERQVDLAKDHGVTRGTIWKIVHHRIWRHVK